MNTIYYQLKYGDREQGIYVDENAFKAMNPDEEELINAYIYEQKRTTELKKRLDDVSDKINKRAASAP